MKYYFFYIEIALKNKKDLNIYAFKNVSDVPTKKLIKIFKIDVEKDPHILEGYFLKKKMYKKHKKYIKQTIGPFNFDLFEYCLRVYSGKDFGSIRSMYKESLME